MDGTLMRHSHLLCVFLLMYVLLGGMKVNAMECYIGNEPDANGTMKWVLPYRDPCECTSEIRLGSINTQPPLRPFTPTYFDLSAVGIKSLNSVIDLLNCTKKEQECETFETSGYQYHYEFAPLPKSPDGQVFVKFFVRAEHNAHISLVGQNNDLPDMYEIVIGGWLDTGSAIRKCKRSCDKASVDTTNGWLDGQTFKHFWVSATPGTSQNGTKTMTISVGRGSDTNSFMKYVDPSPLPVNYLGFSFWNNVNGIYKFCGLDLKN